MTSYYHMKSFKVTSSKRPGFPAPGIPSAGGAFFPGPGPGQLLAFGREFGREFSKKNLADLLKFYIYFFKFHNIISVLANDIRHKH